MTVNIWKYLLNHNNNCVTVFGLNRTSSPLFGCSDFGTGTGNHLRAVPLRLWEYFQILADILSQVKMSTSQRTLKCGAMSSYLQCETVPIGGEAKETKQITKTMRIRTGCRPHCTWPSCVYGSVHVNEAFTWKKKKKKSCECRRQNVRRGRGSL